MAGTGQVSQHPQRHESRAGTTFAAFLKGISDVGGIDRDLASRAAVAVVCALDRRILGSEAADLRAELPSKLQELVKSCEIHQGKPERFGRAEMMRQIAADLGTAPVETEAIVRAVFLALRTMVSEGEAEQVGGMLPPDIRELWRRPS